MTFPPIGSLVDGDLGRHANTAGIPRQPFAVRCSTVRAAILGRRPLASCLAWRRDLRRLYQRNVIVFADALQDQNGHGGVAGVGDEIRPPPIVGKNPPLGTNAKRPPTRGPSLLHCRLLTPPSWRL